MKNKENLILGEALEILPTIDSKSAQLIIADPPYFQVVNESWDNSWDDHKDYLGWTFKWVKECKRILKDDGLFYIFGQLGKREHIWLSVCDLVTKKILQFHDMIIWDRVVGYNDRKDSFTPQYEMILSLRKYKNSKPYFNKDAVRTSYADETINKYLKDKRYKNKEAREKHLHKGKYETNIFRVPSLKGSSKEKVGHPTQKPENLIRKLILSSSRENDLVLDPFLGSGTTAIVAKELNRKWIGIEINKKYYEIIRDRLS